MPHYTEKAQTALALLAKNAKDKKIVVVGDIMLDQFLYGDVERISPEAPVPVVEIKRETFHLGGAANVVRNLSALGANVDLVGVIGDDAWADTMRDLLAKTNTGCEGLVVDASRPTAKKTRIIAQHQQVVRFDREDRTPFNDEIVEQLAASLTQALTGADAVIVSDYGKGTVCDPVMEVVRNVAIARGLPVAVDPKPLNFKRYREVGVITPNAKETEAMSGLSPVTDEGAEAAGKHLMEELGTRSILVTRGENGMTLVERSGEVTHIPTRAKDVFDVTGAGDTSISVFTLAWACGATLAEAACISNSAGGFVVGKLGTAVVTLKELGDALQAEHADS
jgi:D-beta-D-heptose 7-phosphate kinase/D-beta-D-heptose 1-phosphate adenosyltransferase